MWEKAKQRPASCLSAEAHRRLCDELSPAMVLELDPAPAPAEGRDAIRQNHPAAAAAGRRVYAAHVGRRERAGGVARGLAGVGLRREEGPGPLRHLPRPQSMMSATAGIEEGSEGGSPRDYTPLSHPALSRLRSATRAQSRLTPRRRPRNQGAAAAHGVCTALNAESRRGGGTALNADSRRGAP
jgi:hypothetical protein